MRRCLSCPDAKSCRADGSDSASRLAAILQTPWELPAAAQQAPPIVDLPPPPPGGVARVPRTADVRLGLGGMFWPRIWGLLAHGARTPVSAGKVPAILVLSTRRTHERPHGQGRRNTARPPPTGIDRPDASGAAHLGRRAAADPATRRTPTSRPDLSFAGTPALMTARRTSATTRPTPRTGARSSSASCQQSATTPSARVSSASTSYWPTRSSG